MAGQDVLQFFTRCLMFGIGGILLECLFTGIKSAITLRDVHGTCRTTLDMVLVYGTAGPIMETVKLLPAPWFALTMFYLVVIYGSELAWGAFFRRVTGSCPWDYGRGRWTPYGLINLKYFPFWFAVAAMFGKISDFLHWIVRVVFVNAGLV